MAIFALTLVRFVRAVYDGLSDPEFRALLVLLLVQCGLGTIFYHKVERWSILDALYFFVVTLATVGYGDFSPVTTAGKVFTMIYIVTGVGLLVAFANKLVRSTVAKRQAHREVRRGDHQGDEVSGAHDGISD
jgi:voltage-gated potassium channel